MNCETVSSLIEEFYDGEVDLHLKLRVEEHIAACALCSADFNKLVRLDRILEKSSTPPGPSAMLDRKLMQDFELQHEKVSKSPAWWRRIFAGSVSVPKPAFAVALILVALAVTAANIIGRFAERSIDVGLIAPAA